MTIRKLIFLCVLSTTLLGSGFAFAASNILVIHSYHPDHTWVRFIQEGIDTTFEQFPSARVYHEYLDAKRFPQDSYQQEFMQYLEKKYTRTPPNVILVSDDAALKAVRTYRTGKLAVAPIVFMGINEVSQELTDAPGITGVYENRDLATTAREIKEFTGQDELIIITDTSKAGLGNLKKIEEAEASVEMPSTIHVIKNLKKDKVYDLHDRYSKTTPILLIGQLIDPSQNNALIGWLDGAKHVSSVLKNPIFTIGIVTVGHGATGADNLFAKDHSSQAARLAIKILTGTQVDEIKPIAVAESEWIFDWQRLKFHGIPKSNLPQGSRLINVDKSFFGQYKTPITVAISSVLGICLGLLIARFRQRKKAA